MPKRSKVGEVVKKSGDKTIKVRVKIMERAPLYKKYIRKNRYFLAHDEKNIAKVGDKVEIIESRPISARKHFILKKIIKGVEGKE